MSTIAELHADLLALITTPLTATGLTFAEELEALTTDIFVPDGEVRLQISLSPATRSGDSNNLYQNIDCVLKLAYRVPLLGFVPDATLQIAWTEQHLHTIALVMLDRTSWQTLDTVVDLITVPTGGIPEKDGNVVFSEFVAEVRLNP